jgi:hypothetical protein
LKKHLLVLGVTLALSCGGDSGPLSASAVLVRTLRVVSGDTGEPVGGAQVVLDGRAYTSTAAGEVAIETEAPAARSVRVDTAGYLLRETIAPRTGADAITLWPLHGRYSEEYVRTLLYKPSDTTRREPSPMPDQPLMRVTSPWVSIVPTLEMRGDLEAMEAIRRAVAVINEATAGRVAFSLDDAPSAPVVFRLLFDENVRDGAFTYRTLRGSTIVGGRIVFSNRGSFRPARDVRYVAHELGHVLGLQHSIVATDMMYYTAHVTSPEVFTADERLTIKLLLQRTPGNRFPDRDPQG